METQSHRRLTDNASTNGAIAKLCAVKYPFVTWYGCAAHALQLCVKRICEIPHFALTLNKVNSLVKCFVNNKFNYHQFHAMQPAPAKNLLYWCETRWTSRYVCMGRLRECKTFIMNFAVQPAFLKLGISEDFWNVCEIIESILFPFYVCVNNLQCDNSNLVTVVRCYNDLLKDVQKVEKQLQDANEVVRLMGYAHHKDLLDVLFKLTYNFIDWNIDKYVDGPQIHGIKYLRACPSLRSFSHRSSNNNRAKIG